jgi:hypothetical protein
MNFHDHAPLRSTTAWKPDAIWQAGPRVRVDTFKRGDRFRAIDGMVYTYDRVDGVSKGVHHVTSMTGAPTSFAGCAEGVKQP